MTDAELTNVPTLRELPAWPALTRHHAEIEPAAPARAVRRRRRPAASG